MLRRDASSAAGRHANDERNRELAARHMRNGDGVVDDLIEREQAEIHGHDFHDRSHPRHGGADPRADEGALRERRVTNALLAKLLKETLCHCVAAAIAADVLAHQEDA